MDFKRSYAVYVIDEVPGDARCQQVYYYPPGETKGGIGHGGGMIVRVVLSTGQDWFGIFAPGIEGRNVYHSALTTPNPDALCVISRGAGYFVQASNPEEWVKIEAFPIRNIVTTHYPPVMVFADETRLSAYGKEGHLWCIEVSLEGFVGLQASEMSIQGQAFRENLLEMASFRVDIRTGELLWM